ncbi:hypothetical protein BDF19DRAFT_438718 [Syncephalis fuscata]|nr:hypothetical protein BDF19DRAFT_438718 [Syncephalis fuscata]
MFSGNNYTATTAAVSPDNLFIDDDDELVENIHCSYGYFLTQAKASNGALLRMTIDQFILLYNDIFPQRRVELIRLLSVISDICSMDANVARPERSWLALDPYHPSMPKPGHEQLKSPQAQPDKEDPLARLMAAAELSVAHPQDPDLLRSSDALPIITDELQLIPRALICRCYFMNIVCSDPVCCYLHTRAMRPSRVPLCFRFRAGVCDMGDNCSLQHVSPILARARRRYIRKLEKLGTCLYVPLELAKTLFDGEYVALAQSGSTPEPLILADFNRFIGHAKSSHRLVSMEPQQKSQENDDDDDDESAAAMADMEPEQKERILADRQQQKEWLAVVQPNQQAYLQVRRAPNDMTFASLSPAELRGRLQLLLPVNSETQATHLLHIYNHAYRHRLMPTTFTPSKDPRFFLLWLRARGLVVKRDGTVLVTKERDAPGAYRAERRILALDALTDMPLPSKAWRYLRHEDATSWQQAT